MSRNSKYYVKRLKTTPNQRSLLGFLRKPSDRIENDAEVEVTAGPVQQIPDVSDDVESTTSPAPEVAAPSLTTHATEQQCSECELTSATKNSADVEKLKPDWPEPYDARKSVNLKYELRYTWLYYSSVKNGFICKSCEMFGQGLSSEPSFVAKGATLGSHPTRRLEIHEGSTRHKTATERMTYYKTNMDSFKAFSEKISQKRKTDSEEEIERNRRYMEKLVKITMFLVKKKWGHTENLRDMVELVADVGDAEVAQILTQAVNYTSSKSATDLVSAISHYFKNNTLQQLRGRKFTLFLDETTDNGNRSQTSLMARWVGEMGVVETFLGLAQMSSTKAVDFENAVREFCTGNDIDPADIRFVALDGCNTMSGEKTGLQKRVRHMAPHSLYINCRNHRLALCFVHIVKNGELLQEVESLLVAIWKLFHFSARRNAVFQSMQEVYGERPLTFIKASATRWLSHLRASVRFIARYECLLDTLDSLIAATKDPEIEGIRMKASDKRIVFTILLLTDVLKPVNLLSLYLQGDTGFFTNLQLRVKACIDDLHEIIHQYEQGDFQELEFSKADGLADIILERTTYARRLRGESPDMSPQDYLQNVGIPIIYELINEITDAFNEKSGVLSAFSVLDPAYLPNTAADVIQHGNEKIHTLAEHYGRQQRDTFQGHVAIAPADVDISVEQELLAFRTHLFMMKQRAVDAVETVEDVHKEFVSDPGLRACFPNVQFMYNLALLIPQSTAVVERSFSLLNDICTFLRTSLTTEHLEELMRINFNMGALANSDISKIIDLFKKAKDRQMSL